MDVSVVTQRGNNIKQSLNWFTIVQRSSSYVQLIGCAKGLPQSCQDMRDKCNR
jgi:hypothetical protein